MSLTFSQLANAGSAGNDLGNWLNFISFLPPEGTNAESGASSAPANGPEFSNHLHFNPYPDTAAPGQTNGCEAGNEKYLVGKTVIGQAPVWGTTTK
jgi:hypothetical protein